MSKSSVILAVVLLILATGATAKAADTPAELAGVGFDQRLNEQVPLDLEFVDEAGKPVKLGDYFHSKPVILVLAYYQCPRLCTMVLNGLVQGLLEIPYTAGKDFEVVVVSFDPREVSSLAASKKEAYMSRYGRPGSEAGWHFLVGREDQSRALADAVGFRYRYDDRKDQFIHASGITILTPEGRLSRYLYDVKFSGRDLRLALVEASQHKIGTPVEQILLYCFHYDPTLGKYSANVMLLIRLCGVLTMAAIVCFVWGLRRRAANSNSQDVAVGGER